MSKILTLNSKIITHNGKSLVNINNIAKATGLKAWYATRLEPVVANDTSIAALSDFSNNATALAQGTGANQPKYKTNWLGTFPAWFFDGANDSFLFSDNTLGKNKPGITVYMVFKNNRTTANQTIFQLYNNAGVSRFVITLNTGTSANNIFVGCRRANEASVAAQFAQFDLLTDVFCGVADYTNNLLSAWFNGVLRQTVAIGGTAGANSENLNSASSGAVGSGASGPFQGAVFEVVFCEAAHTPSEVANNMAALRIIYGGLPL